MRKISNDLQLASIRSTPIAKAFSFPFTNTFQRLDPKIESTWNWLTGEPDTTCHFVGYLLTALLSTGNALETEPYVCVRHYCPTSLSGTGSKVRSKIYQNGKMFGRLFGGMFVPCRGMDVPDRQQSK